MNVKLLTEHHLEFLHMSLLHYVVGTQWKSVFSVKKKQPDISIFLPTKKKASPHRCSFITGEQTVFQSQESVASKGMQNNSTDQRETFAKNHDAMFIFCIPTSTSLLICPNPCRKNDR